MNGLRPSVLLYIVAVAVAALAVLLAAVLYTGLPDRHQTVIALLMTGLLILALRFPLHVGEKTKLVFDTSVLFAAVLLFGPAVAIVVAGSGMLAGQFLRRASWVQMVFNSAQAMLQAAGASLLMTAAGWRLGDLSLNQPAQFLVIPLAVAVMYVINTSAVAIIIALQSGQPLRPVWQQLMRNLDPLEHLAQLAIGFLAVIVVNSAIWALPLLILPATVSYRAVAHRLRQEPEMTAKSGPERPAGHFQRLLDSASDGVFSIDQDGRCTFINRAAAELLGYAPEDLLGQAIHQIIHHTRKDGTSYPGDSCPDFTALKLGRGMRLDDEILWRHDGAMLHVHYAVSPIVESGNITGAVVVFSDSSERHALQERLRHQALHDPLTGLPNRILFMHRLDQRLANPEQSSAALAVLFLDLDGFKFINDALGHEAGDQVLVVVAERLNACVREGDTVARFGGDEFTILLDSLAETSDATEIAARIVEHLQEPITVNQYRISLTLSVGVALSLSPRDLSGDLLRHADAAMYAAKADGKARFTVFDSRGQVSARDRSYSACRKGPSRTSSDGQGDHDPAGQAVRFVRVGKHGILRLPVWIDSNPWKLNALDPSPPVDGSFEDGGLEDAG